jgi:xylulokinase
MLVAGVDSSTQSTKVVLCRSEDGEPVGQGTAPHPPGTECDPQAWWTALLSAGDGLLRQAAAVALTLLPYLDGERTPNRPAATGVLRGLSTRNASQQNLARAAVEAVLCSPAEAADRLAQYGVASQRVVLIGGAARSAAVCQLAAGIFGVPVVVPEPAEYVAIGAARQAAWALARSPSPPDWPARPAVEYCGTPQPEVRRQHVELREAAAGWQRSAG